ncbi:Receptor-like protein kinase [Quillaja saponaria]|uniref:Receptor-like protein kinase n=1 Tax=Quillaja saponaria TaxID=32244 RepID=A0AAD7KUU2_QUISA|nr:Receptor-like protein kinase [Quillaja saponaria]
MLSLIFVMVASMTRKLFSQNCVQIRSKQLDRYNECMLRYSNRSIFGIVDSHPTSYLYNLNNATNLNLFNQALGNLLEKLKTKAASGSSIRKFATGNATGQTYQIYALVQCTPDLSEQECSDCIEGVISEIPNCCEGSIGVRIDRPSCDFMYDNFRFYDPTIEESEAEPVPSPQQSTNDTLSQKLGEKSNTSRTVIIIVVSIVAFVVVMVIFICIYLRLRKPRKTIETVDDIKSVDSLQFDFNTTKVATDNFSDANKLGQGGFGAVYKGRLSSGQEIAVKRLSRESGQGDLEFKNEVQLMAKLQHKNLVRFLGFCLEGSERLLIYEFVPNKSLDYFIFDQTKREQLGWERRYRIIGGIARGLLYLHEDSRIRIIHRDLKPSNILLDTEMNPKISDFGTARLFAMDQTQGNTLRIAGTYGYMAPEYAMLGQFSVKSDVYSFGVLVLEIVSGQKNSGFNKGGDDVEHLISYAWINWREGKVSNLIDPTMDEGSRDEMMRCIHIALLCVQKNVTDRPTMASVILMFSSYSMILPVPSQPAFFMHSSGVTRLGDSVPVSVNEDSITEPYPR